MMTFSAACKWILIVVGVVAIVVVGAVFLLVSNVDSIAKAGVEKYASEAVKANVTLQEVTISTTSGEGSLRGLKVGNPQGFNTESAIEFGEVSVALDVLSLASDTVVIKSVVITAPQVTYEIGAAGSNIDALRKNVADYTGASPGSASTAAASGGAAAGEGGPQAGDRESLRPRWLRQRERHVPQGQEAECTPA